MSTSDTIRRLCQSSLLHELVDCLAFTRQVGHTRLAVKMAEHLGGAVVFHTEQFRRTYPNVVGTTISALRHWVLRRHAPIIILDNAVYYAMLSELRPVFDAALASLRLEARVKDLEREVDSVNRMLYNEREHSAGLIRALVRERDFADQGGEGLE
jgi:hypothetical protein